MLHPPTPTLLLVLALGLVPLQPAATAPLAKQDTAVHFQAHRGGLREVPENTMAAFRYAWDLGGIPEVDICTTKDGEIICLHDSTLARTTNAPDAIKDLPVEELTLAEIRKWDCGTWFDPRFRGERVPELREVFAEMRGHASRQVYLDFKKLDLAQLADLIAEYGAAKQIIFCHNTHQNCITLQGLAPDVRTMLWIGGKPDEIKAKFERARATGFKGLNQVQLHLKKPKPGERPGFLGYSLDPSFVTLALEQTNAAGIDLEVLPFEFDAVSIAGLLELGIRWYATDEPKRFMDCVAAWRNRVDGREES